MKKTIKILISISLVLTLFLCTGIISLASVSEGAKYEGYDEQLAENVTADNTEELTANVFSRVFEEIKNYATEIFCAMTFVGSLILAYAYKKGLLPLVEKALVSIGSAVTNIKEKTESGELAAKDLGIQLTKRLDSAQELMLTLTERIQSMDEVLSEVKKKEDNKETDSKNLSLIVSAQIDMLYDIFMTSALPQYQKDAIGERVAVMKEALRGDAKET